MKFKLETIKNHMIVQILGAVVLGMGLPILLNKLLVVPTIISAAGAFGDTILRYLIGPLFLLPLGYELYFKKIYQQNQSALRLTALVKESGLGLLCGGLAITVIVGLIYISGLLQFSGFNPSIQVLPVILPVLAFVVTEEFFFRGILYRIIEEQAGTFLALLISAVLFSALHLTNDHYSLFSFVSILLGGLFTGLMYTYTKRLWLPVFAHFAWNYTQILFGLSVSGADTYTNGAVILTQTSGNPILSGGAFGPENSLFALLVSLILVVVFFRLSQKEGKFIKRKTKPVKTPVTKKG